ncbi:MAG: NAD(P)H-binding protein [Rhodospirillaceae bacterium]|nr:NAD(P)H-binding protein [Rhodospirillaceae bacterium]
MRSILIAAAAIFGLILPAASLATANGPILVFGGTGKLGSEVVKMLVAAGEDVTVFVRAGSDRGALAGLDVDYVVGDLMDEASVAAAFDAKPFFAVIDASANRPGTGAEGGPDRDSAGFYERIMRPMATHAKRTGVKHFILHGSVLAGDNINLFPQFAFLKGSSTLADKGRAEALLIDSGVPYTIIRHGRVPNDPQPSPTGNAYLTGDQAVFGDVTRGDLAILTLDVLGNPGRLGRVFHAFDPTFKIERPLPTALRRSVP